jgi:hypothetical protein
VQQVQHREDCREVLMEGHALCFKWNLHVKWHWGGLLIISGGYRGGEARWGQLSLRLCVGRFGLGKLPSLLDGLSGGRCLAWWKMHCCCRLFWNRRNHRRQECRVLWEQMRVLRGKMLLVKSWGKQVSKWICTKWMQVLSRDLTLVDSTWGRWSDYEFAVLLALHDRSSTWGLST